MDGECWWGSRESPEFGFGHVEYTHVCVCSTYVMKFVYVYVSVGIMHMSPEFMREVWVREITLGILNIQMELF